MENPVSVSIQLDIIFVFLWGFPFEIIIDTSIIPLCNWYQIRLSLRGTESWARYVSIN